MHYTAAMKTAQLPPVRVAPAIRAEIEAVLQEGESLSEFVESSAIEAARRRKAQADFLVRGRASLVEAKRTGELYEADSTLENMRKRLDAKVRTLQVANTTPVKVRGKR